MGYLKVVAYIYLVAAIYLLGDAIWRVTNGDNAVISFVLSGLAFFMFFFRLRFSKKFQDKNKQ